MRPGVLLMLAPSLSVLACVNNYVADDGAVGTGASTAGASDTAADASTESRATKGDGDHGDGSGPGDSGTGSLGDDGGDGGDTVGLEACKPCTTDAECGDLYDLCVQLTGGETVCTRACTEQPPCGTGFVCQPTTSVDGQIVDQCVPESGMCVGS